MVGGEQLVLIRRNDGKERGDYEGVVFSLFERLKRRGEKTPRNSFFFLCFVLIPLRGPEGGGV